MSKLNIIAWNVNSIRALTKKVDLNNFLEETKCDIFCMSETKLSQPDTDIQNTLKTQINGYKYRYYHTSIVRKGYSGTAIWSKFQPLKVVFGLENLIDDNEGRVITMVFKQFTLVHVYTPNSGKELARLDFRINYWDNAFWQYIKDIPNVIVCGDFNVARFPIDIHSPKTNLKSPGYTIQERNSINKHIDQLDLIDVYREQNKNVIAYTYWSYLAKSRDKNKGWRIDYFLVSKKLYNNVDMVAYIISQQLGSDHAPIILSVSKD